MVEFLRERRARRFQDLIRAAQLTVLALELSKTLALLAGQSGHERLPHHALSASGRDAASRTSAYLKSDRLDPAESRHAGGDVGVPLGHSQRTSSWPKKAAVRPFAQSRWSVTAIGTRPVTFGPASGGDGDVGFQRYRSTPDMEEVSSSSPL